MNKIQKITIVTMAVFAALMFAGPIAMNLGSDSAFAAHFHGHHHHHHGHHHGHHHHHHGHHHHHHGHHHR